MVGVRVRNAQGVTGVHSSDEFPPAAPPSSCGDLLPSGRLLVRGRDVYQLLGRT
jgi:hypothetical protein